MSSSSCWNVQKSSEEEAEVVEVEVEVIVVKQVVEPSQPMIQLVLILKKQKPIPLTSVTTVKK